MNLHLNDCSGIKFTVC